MFEEYSKHDVAVYGGYLLDEEKLKQSASGGIATALSEHMIEQGGYVAGVVYSNDFYRAEYVLVNDKSSLDKLKGSKYIDSDKKNIFADVKNLLDSGEKVLFIGVPCVVGALYKFIGERPQNLLTCELICHGPTGLDIHKEYLTYLENKYQSKLVNFSSRYKKNGARVPVYLRAEFENGQIFEQPFAESAYGIACSVYGLERCYNCKFKGNNRQGDIMVGDNWRATSEDEFWNKYGLSSVFAETEKGNEFLKSTEGISLFPITFEKAARCSRRVVTPALRHKNRDKFVKLLSKKGLIYAAKHSVAWKTRVISAVTKMTPRKMKPLLKKMHSFYCVLKKR